MFPLQNSSRDSTAVLQDFWNGFGRGKQGSYS